MWDSTVYKDDGIKKYAWEKYWSSSRCLLSCSYWGYYYTRILASQFGKGFSTTLIISKQGYSTCYFDEKNRHDFGVFRVKQIREGWPNSVYNLVAELKQRADALIGLTNILSQKKISILEWNLFIEEFFGYIGLHISPRNIIDCITPNEVADVKDILTEARLYTEPVYQHTEKFVAAVAEQISRDTGCRTEYILCCFKEEIEMYFDNGFLPDESLLEARHRGCALWWNPDQERIVVQGEEMEMLEKEIITFDEQANSVIGTGVFPGRAIGRAKIIYKPEEAVDFAEGDILITSMTRPEFIFLMKKASAIVTDTGGILCHAAITAREIKKPTVIGTNSATKIFKNNDMIEVDADKGIVKNIMKL